MEEVPGGARGKLNWQPGGWCGDAVDSVWLEQGKAVGLVVFPRTGAAVGPGQRGVMAPRA
jgi:hypothetical protein